MGICSNNCTLWQSSKQDSNITDPKCKADPDIAGVGIVIAFVASAFITLYLSIFHLILTASSGSSDNWLDVRIFKHVCVRRTAQQHGEFWKPIIEDVVLSLSDQQLLTGIAILVAGFWTHCTISVYHFSIINDLAFFSSNVHLITVEVLRDRLKERPRRRNWRVSLMVCSATLLAVSCVMEGHWAWDQSWCYDAQCLFDDLTGNVSGKPAFWMGFNLSLIIFGYSSCILSLYGGLSQRISNLLDGGVLEKPIELLGRHIQRLKNDVSRIHGRTSAKDNLIRFNFAISIVMLHIIRVTILSLAVLLGSSCISNLINIFWFAYSFWSLLVDRTIPASQLDGSENIMSFGQIVPIILLSSTLFVFREAYDGQVNEAKKSESPPGHTDQINTTNNRNASVTSLETAVIPLQDRELATENPLASPRRADTEMGGRITASGRREGPPRPHTQNWPMSSGSWHT